MKLFGLNLIRADSLGVFEKITDFYAVLKILLEAKTWKSKIYSFVNNYSYSAS